MKSLLIAAAAGAVILSSCSVYRQGQTPDDVYYSPAKKQSGAAYAQTNDDYVEGNSGRGEGRRYYDDPSYSGYDSYATPDDRWLMMRVRNPYRWSAFDYYSPYNAYSPYSFYSPYSSFGLGYQPGWSFGLGFGGFSPFGLGVGYGFYDNFYNWNGYYNPYYAPVYVINPKGNYTPATRQRTFNLNNYSNNYSNRSGVRPQFNNTNRARYNNSNNSTLGNSFRRAFSNSNSNSSTRRPNDSYYSPRQEDRPVRSYNPSSSNSSNYNNSINSGRSSGSSGGGGGVQSGGSSGSRPTRR